MEGIRESHVWKCNKMAGLCTVESTADERLREIYDSRKEEDQETSK